MHGRPRSRMWLGATLVLPLLVLGAGLWLEFGGMVEARRAEEQGQATAQLELVRDRFEESKIQMLRGLAMEGIQIDEQEAPVAPFRSRMPGQDRNQAADLSTAALIGLEKESSGKHAEALPFLVLACKDTADSRPHLAKARCLWNLDRQAEALELLRAMMKRSATPEPGFLLPAPLRAAALTGDLLAKAGRHLEVASLQRDFYSFRWPVPIEAAESSDQFFASLSPVEATQEQARYRCLAQAWRHLEIHGLPAPMPMTSDESETVLASGTLLARTNADQVSVMDAQFISNLLNKSLKLAPEPWGIHASANDAINLDDPATLASVDLAPLPIQLVSRPTFLLDSRLLQSLGRGLMVLALLSFVLGNLLVWRMLRRELELSRLRSDFIDLISHELRTPLTALSLKAEMLAHGEVRADKVASYQRGLKTEVDRLSLLVGEILDFARLEKGRTPLERRETSPRALLARGLGEARSALRLSGHRIRVDASRDLPALDVDMDLLARALRNLLENASKYAPEGSEIRLGAEVCDAGLRLTVTDQGPGIPRPDRERIFEPFIRGENALGKPGSGLGLALVRQAVEAHGGRVRVEDGKPQGSRFSVTLPLGEVA
jgi:signal transduction histidine kinase